MTDWRRPLLPALALGAVLGLAMAPTAAAAPSAPRSSAGPARADVDQVLVTVEPGRRGAVALDGVAADGLAVRRTFPDAGVAVVATEGRPVGEVLAELEADPGVRTATPDFFRRASAIPDDPEFPSQRASLAAMRLPAAWDVTTGARSQVIAILDSGVDLDHPDLAAKLVPGFDAVERDGRPDDDQGHGTFVAGMAAARTDNGVGVAGAAWRARIMPVKVLDREGFGSDSQVIEGMDWALDNGADVLNLSLSGTDANPALDAAVAAAVERGAVVVAAAGNDATTAPNYPAASPGAIAVGATNANGRLAYFSNWGEWVDVVAPGFLVTSTVLDAYGVGSGTSFSAPLVAGVASLVRARKPELSAAAVTERLLASARDLGAQGLDPHFGRGMVDALAALGADPAPVATPAVDGDGTPARSTPLAVGGAPTSSTLGPEGDVDWYRLDVGAATPVRVTVTPPPFDGGRAAELAPVLRALGPDLARLGEVRGNDSELADRVRPMALTFTAPAGASYVSVRNGLGSRGAPAYEVVVEAQGSGPAPSSGPVEWVRDVAPVERSARARPRVTPRVTFGRDIDPRSVEEGVVLYGGLAGRPIRASVTWDDVSRTATVDPVERLRPGRPYYLRVQGVVDGAGRRMGEVFLSPFTVG